MQTSRRWMMWSVPVIGALAGLMGCAEIGTAEPPESAEDLAPLAAGEAGRAEGREARGKRGAFGRFGHGGPGRLLVAALDELTLSDAQRAAIQGALDGLPKGPHEAGPKGGAAFEALAQGVRVGKVDETAVLAKAEETGGPGKEHRAALASAVRTLHQTLTGDQRRALVAILDARIAEHGPEHARAMDGEPGPRGERPGKRGPLDPLLRGIDLRDEQRARIDAALAGIGPKEPDAEAMKQRFEAKRGEMRARLSSFASDSFDANAFVTPPAEDGEHGPKAHFEHLVKGLAIVAPMLDPAQRDALATRLEEGPRFGPGGHGPKGPRGQHEDADRDGRRGRHEGPGRGGPRGARGQPGEAGR